MSYRPITDFWLLTRCKYLGGVKRYGGYLGGFPERARALLGATIDEPVLHVCGGLAKLYPYRGGFGPNDKTLDLDPNVKPDYERDVTSKPLPKGFKAMLADPPYSEIDARQYYPGEAGYPNPHKLMAAMLAALEPGQRAGMIHYIIPRATRHRFVACVGIGCGFANRVRVYTVFERI